MTYNSKNKLKTVCVKARRETGVWSRRGLMIYGLTAKDPLSRTHLKFQEPLANVLRVNKLIWGNSKGNT